MTAAEQPVQRLQSYAGAVADLELGHNIHVRESPDREPRRNRVSNYTDIAKTWHPIGASLFRRGHACDACGDGGRSFPHRPGDSESKLFECGANSPSCQRISSSTYTSRLRASQLESLFSPPTPKHPNS